MRREPQKWEYNREVSLYNKNDYRSKFYKGRWEKAWIIIKCILYIENYGYDSVNDSIL